MRGGDAASHSPDPRTTHEKTRTATATGEGCGGTVAAPHFRPGGGAEGAAASWARPTAAGGCAARVSRDPGPGGQRRRLAWLSSSTNGAWMATSTDSPTHLHCIPLPQSSRDPPASPASRAGPPVLPHSSAKGGAPALEFDPGGP